jgi:hypothetical protein
MSLILQTRMKSVMFMHTGADIWSQERDTSSQNVPRAAVNHCHLAVVAEGRRMEEMQYWFTSPSHPWEGWHWNTTQYTAANTIASVEKLLNVQDKGSVCWVQAQVKWVASRRPTKCCSQVVSTLAWFERHQFSFVIRMMVSRLKLSSLLQFLHGNEGRAT